MRYGYAADVWLAALPGLGMTGWVEGRSDFVHPLFDTIMSGHRLKEGGSRLLPTIGGL